MTGALRRGVNTVEVDVTTAWMNRLIAEAAMPTVYQPDAPGQRAGLSGPVVLRFLRP